LEDGRNSIDKQRSVRSQPNISTAKSLIHLSFVFPVDIVDLRR
ncbi:unnamed protein product, partial [Schistosoma mattheei]